MNKNIKIILIYTIVMILVIIGCIGYSAYRDEVLSGTIKDTLHKYFENNNTHIASHDFSISDVKIKCRGNNAYLVEFSMILGDKTTTEFDKLGATIYKDNDTWQVKGFGNGLTTDELESYNFKCYK